MRILVVTEHFWPESFQVNDLAIGLKDRGHSVEVVTALPNYPQGRFFDGYGLRGPYRERWNGIPIRRLPVVPRGRGGALRLAANYGSFVAAAAPVLALMVRGWDAMLVFQPTPVTTILPALLMRRRGVPLVAWVQDLWPETLASTGMVRSPALLKGAGALSASLYRNCDRVAVQSPGYVPSLEAAGVRRDRIQYVPNWADAVFDRPRVPPRERHPWQDGFSVMFAGNQGRVQALDTVLDAATLLRDDTRVHWVFVGDGSRRGWLAGEVARRGLARAVHLVDRRPLAEMPQWFASAVAMLVSLNRDPVLSMTIPSKVQAYLCAGAPILASLDGAGAQVVADSGAGFVGPAEDAGALAGNVRRLMALDPEARAQLGLRGRAHYQERFSRGACIDAMEAVLRSAASLDAGKGGTA
jgi:glycosyltransferase involved in cell wall biosynthesis